VRVPGAVVQLAGELQPGRDVLPNQVGDPVLTTAPLPRSATGTGDPGL